MAETILSSMARKLLGELGSQALQQIGLRWGFKDELEKLHNTVSAIKGLLLDAEEQQETNFLVRVWLERLKHELYEADDLIVDLMATQNNSRRKKVCDFFSQSKQFGFRSKIGREIKMIWEKLDAIAAGGIDFNFFIGEGQEEEMMRFDDNKKWEETHQSFTGVDEVEFAVVGREEDKNAIIEHLLDSSIAEDVSVISIVGMGGLGKTTLAQLVYNDERVKKHFERRMWVTTSDVFDVKLIVETITESSVGTESEIIQMDRVEDELKKQIHGKKYFLVLDDMLGSTRDNWARMTELLEGGGKGSKILLTTRIAHIAINWGTELKIYRLQLLPPWDSWTLFEQMAFQHEVKPSLEMLGKQMVRKCAGNPLILRILGGLLGINNTVKEWQYFYDNITQIYGRKELDWFSAVLKLSYDYLPPYLKQCFAYCSVFPADHKIDKQSLIQLWIAQGFIQSSDERKHLEDVGDQYFMHLLRCSFFQDVEKDDLGNAWSCKIHAFMHEFAQSVVGSESCAIGLDANYDLQTTRHVSVTIVVDSSWEIPTYLLEANKLRTLLLRIKYRRMSEASCDKIISSFKRLRVLGLDGFEMKKVPSSIGELSHLRYLDLSNNLFQLLPEYICRLWNLQTLKLNNCEFLKELPRGTKNLVNLRHLEVDNCWNLSHMPCGLGLLTSLRTLTRFVLGGQGASIAGLSDLKSLVNLRGELRIERLSGSTVNKTRKEHPNNYYLSGMECLKSLILGWNKDLDGVGNDELSLFESLRPHSNLKKLQIRRYGDPIFPSWMMDNIGLSLPNIVKISLWHCHSLQRVPQFGLLPSLQVLILAHMDFLEYIYEEEEDCGKSGDYDSSSSEAKGLFPSLKQLSLSHLEGLKGLGSNRRREAVLTTTTATASTSTLTSSSLRCLNALEGLYIESCPQLDLLTDDDENVKQFQSLRSLTTLSIKEMPNLVSLPEGLQCISTLQNLLIQGCPQLTERCQKETGEDWPRIAHIPYIQMSTQSSNKMGGKEALDLRFQQKTCDCGKKAAIRVVDSEKPSKGKLYYVCDQESCKYWAWCDPVTVT